MTDQPDEAKAQAIATQFVANLRELLSEEEFEEMRAVNVHHLDDGVCASHDYCDANMPMSDAFATVMGREIFADEDSTIDTPQGQADCALWNRAWDIAKARDLTAPEGGAE